MSWHCEESKYMPAHFYTTSLKCKDRVPDAHGLGTSVRGTGYLSISMINYKGLFTFQKATLQKRKD